MPYSHLLMTFVFNKLWCDGRAVSAAFRVAWIVPLKEAIMWTDLRRSGFRAREAAATHPAIRCVSTLRLCNANFARS